MSCFVQVALECCFVILIGVNSVSLSLLRYSWQQRRSQNKNVIELVTYFCRSIYLRGVAHPFTSGSRIALRRTKVPIFHHPQLYIALEVAAARVTIIRTASTVSTNKVLNLQKSKSSLRFRHCLFVVLTQCPALQLSSSLSKVAPQS